MIIETTYKLIKRNAEGSQIQVKSNIKPNQEGTFFQSDQASLTYTLEGSQEGTFTPDPSGSGGKWECRSASQRNNEITTNGKTLNVPITMDGITSFETVHEK